jgi:hypothetical protein
MSGHADGKAGRRRCVERVGGEGNHLGAQTGLKGSPKWNSMVTLSDRWGTVVRGQRVTEESFPHGGARWRSLGDGGVETGLDLTSQCGTA